MTLQWRRELWDVLICCGCLCIRLWRVGGLFTILLFEAVEYKDSGRPLHPQLQPFRGLLAVLVHAEHVVLHPRSVDVVLKQVNVEGLGNACKREKLQHGAERSRYIR